MCVGVGVNGKELEEASRNGPRSSVGQQEHRDLSFTIIINLEGNPELQMRQQSWSTA